MQATPHPARVMLMALLLALLPPAESANAQDAWQTLAGADKSFTVELPAVPEYTANELKTGAGAAYKMHQYILEQGDLAYVVQMATYPAEVDLANPRANLQGGLDNAAKSMDGGKWARIDWLMHQGHMAVSAVGVRRGSAVRSFAVLNGRRIVTLTYAGPIGSAQSPAADRFIGSLKLDPTP
jgi:hypothetical protein